MRPRTSEDTVEEAARARETQPRSTCIKPYRLHIYRMALEGLQASSASARGRVSLFCTYCNRMHNPQDFCFNIQLSRVNQDAGRSNVTERARQTRHQPLPWLLRTPRPHPWLHLYDPWLHLYDGTNAQTTHLFLFKTSRLELLHPFSLPCAPFCAPCHSRPAPFPFPRHIFFWLTPSRPAKSCGDKTRP